MVERKTYDPTTGQITATSRILGSTTQVTTYQYYGNGAPGASQVKKMVNPAGQWTRYAYDFRGQLAYR